jgi:hypothetical protein
MCSFLTKWLSFGVHEKGKFLAIRIFKLQSRGDDSFQVLEWINNNVYKVDLLWENGVNATFNISDLSLFNVGDDLRSNHFEERENDENR